MDAFVISIGSELLTGHTINTNASWLASQLNMAGIGIREVRAIPDKLEDITAALNDAGKKASLVLVTGGLGPTNDDITMNALCSYTGSGLVVDQKVLEDIRQFFKKRGRDPGKVNLDQAMVPEKALKVIRNPNGTAPGLWMEKNGITIIAMPGVPHEMQHMFTAVILPELIKLFPGNHIIHRHVLTQGIGESFLASRISFWENDLPPEISLAYLPSAGIVKLRLTGRGKDGKRIRDMIEEQITKLKRIIPEYIWGYDMDQMEEVAGRMLREKGLSLSTAESCTGGYLAHRITLVPGSSDYYRGSIIAYSNSLKELLLGVSPGLIENHGAVSGKVAEAMASGARKRLGTDFSVGITGIAGPGGGTAGKPAGTTWIAVEGPGVIASERFIFGDNRERNIIRTANAALMMLIRAIRDQG